MGPELADPLVVELDFALQPEAARTTAASARRGKRRTSTSEVPSARTDGVSRPGCRPQAGAGGALCNIKLGAACYDRQEYAEHWKTCRPRRVGCETMIKSSLPSGAATLENGEVPGLRPQSLMFAFTGAY